ncbi:zinc ABC transporter substrate-binding protein [Candidatus Uhrbacteria bacterium]|nr:zinc ABC transporter substrate-binding protein [Candidatus Uhrbacteria bacterium]
MLKHTQYLVLFFCLLVLFLFIVSFFFATRNTATLPSKKILVATSFYPLAEFSRQVGGEFVEVQSLTPTGVEPHDFEPSPGHIRGIYESDLFIFNGGGVDAWASRLAPSVQQAGVQTLEISRLMKNILPPPQTENEEDSEQEVFDEHFWLSPTLAQRQVEAIRDAFIAIDPDHTVQYKFNADAFIVQLQQLDQDYEQGLAQCDIRVAVTSHAAFAYLARDYDFEQLAITGVSPDEEPSAGALAQLAQTAKALGVPYVFFETLVSPELAQTLSREIGAQTLVFNPLEGLTDEEVNVGKNYLSVMRDNLQNLRTAMICR